MYLIWEMEQAVHLFLDSKQKRATSQPITSPRQQLRYRVGMTAMTYLVLIIAVVDAQSLLLEPTED
jgi:hypothetical protein